MQDVCVERTRSIESPPSPPPTSMYTASGTGQGVAPQSVDVSNESCSGEFSGIFTQIDRDRMFGSVHPPAYTPVKTLEIDDTACESLAISIESKLNSPLCPDSRCIYKVPKPLRAVKVEAYSPTIVSIGPYHNHMYSTETRKFNYLSSFLHDSKSNGDLNIHLQTIKSREAMIHEYYADPKTTYYFKSDEFIEMILLDSVSIIEVFRRVCGHRKMNDDSTLGRPCLLNYIKRDILLAENQLPFFILTDLYRTGFNPANNSQYASFTDMACEVLEVDKTTIDIDTVTREAKCWHLLDLMRINYLPSRRMRGDVKDGNMMCPSITQLYEAGVEFRVEKRKSCSLLDIHFDKRKAILRIPKIKVTDDTEFRLRNLIAFEQCHYPNDFYISEYRLFMDCLINTTNDVELLVKAGIIENWLGSNEEVRDLFNNLGKHVNVNPNNYFYADISRELNAHYNRPWNFYRATLKHNYFSHPWAAIYVIYAVVLLTLTIVQVVMDILSM